MARLGHSTPPSPSWPSSLPSWPSSPPDARPRPLTVPRSFRTPPMAPASIALPSKPPTPTSFRRQTTPPSATQVSTLTDTAQVAASSQHRQNPEAQQRKVDMPTGEDGRSCSITASNPRPEFAHTTARDHRTRRRGPELTGAENAPSAQVVAPPAPRSMVRAVSRSAHKRVPKRVPKRRGFQLPKYRLSCRNAAGRSAMSGSGFRAVGQLHHLDRSYGVSFLKEREWSSAVPDGVATRNNKVVPSGIPGDDRALDRTGRGPLNPDRLWAKPSWPAVTGP